MTVHHDYMFLIFPPPSEMYSGRITAARMQEQRVAKATDFTLFRPKGLHLLIEYDRHATRVMDEVTIPDREAQRCLEDFGVQEPRQLVGTPIQAHVAVNYVAGISKRQLTMRT